MGENDEFDVAGDAKIELVIEPVEDKIGSYCGTVGGDFFEAVVFATVATEIKTKCRGEQSGPGKILAGAGRERSDAEHTN